MKGIFPKQRQYEVIAVCLKPQITNIHAVPCLVFWAGVDRCRSATGYLKSQTANRICAPLTQKTGVVRNVSASCLWCKTQTQFTQRPLGWGSDGRMRFRIGCEAGLRPQKLKKWQNLKKMKALRACERTRPNKEDSVVWTSFSVLYGSEIWHDN